MSELEESKAASITSNFAGLALALKEHIIHALQRVGFIHGFIWDGINDASALKAADVGILVNSAVEIAKQSSVHPTWKWPVGAGAWRAWRSQGVW